MEGSVFCVGMTGIFLLFTAGSGLLMFDIKKQFIIAFIQSFLRKQLIFLGFHDMFIQVR